LHHPNIVEFQGSFVSEGFTYIVLDLHEDGSLDDMIKYRGYLTLPEVRKFSIDIAGGLKYLHAQGIIHRDLKPRNIGLTGGNVKIGDFGLAACVDSLAERRFEQRGTRAYMAPEVLELGGEGYDASVDLWSLGITMYAF
jgi:serine/threonine protein kinase